MRNGIVILFAVVIFWTMMPKTASAVEYCELVSGDGIKFGSEIACGDEHFYILSQNNDGIRVLAKYNLNAGETIYREEKTDPYDSNYCMNLAIANDGAVKRNPFYNAQSGYCFYTKPTYSNDDIYQLEEARSAHWGEDGNFVYPQVGDVYAGIIVSGFPTNGEAEIQVQNLDFAYKTDSGLNANYTVMSEGVDYYSVTMGGRPLDDYTVNVVPLEKIKYSSYNGITPRNNVSNPLGGALYAYQQRLQHDGYNVSQITIPTLNDLNMMASGLGTPLNYDDWGEIDHEMLGEYATRHLRLADYVSDEYSWLWDRSYWLRTGNISKNNGATGGLLFVDSRGDICSTSFNSNQDQSAMVGLCSLLMKTSLGLGVRPMLTVDTLKYRIRTETDGNGEIEVVDTAFSGEEIALRAVANGGFSLKDLVIATEAGEEIVFENDELERDDEGRIVLSTDKFTMPSRNVVITAAWTQDVEEEPETIDENPATFGGLKRQTIIVTICALTAAVIVATIRRR